LEENHLRCLQTKVLVALKELLRMLMSGMAGQDVEHDANLMALIWSKHGSRCLVDKLLDFVRWLAQCNVQGTYHHHVPVAPT
jgi:hypothetical protein